MLIYGVYNMNINVKHVCLYVYARGTKPAHTPFLHWPR